MKKSLAAVATMTGAVVAAGTLLATPAHADIERSVRCAGAVVELNVDREDGRFEVDADIDRAAAGSTWRVTLRHDGRLVRDVRRTADREGDLDVETRRPNTAGKDTFKLAVRPAGGAACSVTVATR